MANLHSNWDMTAGGLRCAGVSDVGMRRTTNQDSMTVALADSTAQWIERGHLMVVADGMGAHAAGELASKLATDTIAHSYHKRPEEQCSEALVEVIREANSVIYNKGQNTVDFQGMGTTCSCLLLIPVGALVAHVGDSRVYRLRGNCFDQLTFDHSLVWEMALAGHATEEEVPAYVPKNVITRSLGPHPTVAVDLEGPFPLETGDRFLICSDGLTGPLKPELIGLVLAALPPVEATQSLVDLANLLGGPDNITVTVSEIVDHKELDGADSSTHPNQTGGGRNRRLNSSSWKSTVANVGLGVGLLAGAGFLYSGYSMTAIACTLVGFVLWLLGKIADSEHPTHSKCGESASLQGRAPYRHHDCSPTAANIEPLNDIVRQLEELENEREWAFDWEPIHADRHRAHQAIAKGEYHEAVVAFCRAVRTLMEGIRKQGPGGPSDSSVR